MRLNLFGGRIEWEDLAIDSRFSHATRDELSVLGTKVEYDYSFVTFSRQKKKTSALD
jgi:hypothetical protein